MKCVIILHSCRAWSKRARMRAIRLHSLMSSIPLLHRSICYRCNICTEWRSRMDLRLEGTCRGSTTRTRKALNSRGRFCRLCRCPSLAPSSLWPVLHPGLHQAHLVSGLRRCQIGVKLCDARGMHACRGPCSTPGALFCTMASTTTDTRCAVQRGKTPGMPGTVVLWAARSPRLRAHAPPCAEGVCAVSFHSSCGLL